MDRGANCRKRPYSPFVPFPSRLSEDTLIVDSFSGEEPVRTNRPKTQKVWDVLFLGANNQKNGVPGEISGRRSANNWNSLPHRNASYAMPSLAETQSFPTLADDSP